MTVSSSDPALGPGAVSAPDPKQAEETQSLRVPASAAALLGWVAVALVNLDAIGNLAPVKSKSAVAARQLHYWVDFAHTLAIGLAVAGVVLLWQRFGSAHRRKTLLAVALGSLVVFEFVLATDLAGASERWSQGRHTTLYLRVLSAVASLTIPGAVVAGMVFGRFWLRGFGMLLGLAIMVVNHRVLVNGYPDGHFWIAATGATLFAASLTGFSAGRWLSPRLGFMTRRLGLIVYAALWLCVLPSLVLRLPSKLSIEMVHRETAFLSRALSQLHARARSTAEIPPELAPFYRPRAGRADLLPHPTRIVPPAPIVLVITIDSFRADLLDPKHKKVAPNIHAMKARAVHFSQARAPASDTRLTLSAVFTGRYFSQLPWSRVPAGARAKLAAEGVVRIPNVLREHEIPTVTAVAYPEALGPRAGVLGGFDVHEIIPGAKRPTSTPRIIDYAIERLKKLPRDESLFFYTHLLDPHAPYESHGKKRRKGRFGAYLGEITYVDGYVGRLRKAIVDLGLADRTMLIVASDHGEAFGENGLLGHNKPLYDVVVRVPLLIEYPGVKPRVVNTPVSLMDIGPTVFDVFGVPTPGFWMADSLVPALLGEPLKPHRPIYMERVASRAVLFANGIKVMLSDSPSAEEIYDTRKDPGEREDLRDTLGADGDRHVALARKYAEVHAWPNGEPPRPIHASASDR